MSSTSEAISQTEHPTRAGKDSVAEDLKRFGPSSTYVAMDVNQANKYCKSLANRHYENFSVASLLLPSSLRQDFYNIYAFCRWSDDLADEMGDATESLRLLYWWRTELHQCFAGIAKHPVFLALAGTIRSHSLSAEPFEQLLDAFVQDQSVTRYRSQLELLDYCRGSANPVGRILLKLARIDANSAQQLSDRICSGLQIANFCQDIRQDALKGRIYLPEDVWQRFQLTEAEILAGLPTANLQFALKVWVELARTLLVSGLPLVKQTPRWLARDIQLFTRGGLTILNNIARSNFNVWTQPIEVSKKQKVALLLRSMMFPRSVHVFELDRPRGTK